MPDLQLLPNAETNPRTNGLFVNEYYQTSKPWLFSCGNVLHVHDLVDNVALEGKQVGLFASLYAQNKLKKGEIIKVTHSSDFSYVLPYTLFEGEGEVELKFRLKKKVVKKWIKVTSAGKELCKKFVLAGVPGEMMTITINKKDAHGEIVLEVE